MKIYENTLIPKNHLSDFYKLVLDSYLYTYQKE